MAKEKAVSVVKPGWKTTEFWMSAGAALAGIIVASGVIPSEGIWPRIVGLVVAFLAARGYGVDRTKIKS